MNLGTFEKRLRSKFQETSSQNSDLFQLLSSQKNTIYTIMYDFDDIDMMIDSGSVLLSKERKILMLEQVFISLGFLNRKKKNYNFFTTSYNSRHTTILCSI